MSYHKEQFARQIRRDISEFLENNIPRPNGSFISVTNVALDDRAICADIFVSIFPDADSAKLFKELRFYEKEARTFLAPRLQRRLIPEIKFHLDDSQSSRIGLEKLLENIKNE